MSDFEDIDDYLTSESTSEDDMELLQGIPKIKNENYLDETVPNYDEETFFMHFRIGRQHVIRFAEQFENSNHYKTQSGLHGKISSLHQVIIFIWFLGHQTSSFRDVADRFNISISSLHRIITRVTIFFSNLSPQIITWPNENEKQEIEHHFRDQGFPHVIGAIDGCHIKIDKPQTDPESFINRKGFYSIHMQVVCDHIRKIRDVFIGYPGSVHDARVFRNSPLCANLAEMCGQYVLLGDSAYPLKANLLVPFKDRGQLTERQVNYNIQLAKNRYIIEHTFGVLKQKFRQLYHIKLRNIQTIVHLIRAACVIHNVCISDEFQIDENDLIENMIALPEHPQIDDDEEEEIDVNVRRVRDNFVNTLRIQRN
ncbi:hypothetical protein NQ318_011893 [Aromia moschata]|uniref:Putative nuclease HARBI1 n=1 Tax=Aromia moschata TaxID=1265417 RepID=A0AAV8YAV9_9CUCU|nr:hypothetical protein NQ318_011893 [Aromia moschata]